MDNSNFKRVTAQFCAVGVIALLSVSKGLSIGFSTIIVPELYKENAEIVVELEELTWISGMNYLATPVGSLASGPLTEWLGRRPVLFLASGLHFIGWMLFRWVVSDFWTLLVAFTLLGLGSGVVVSVGLLYITEVSEPSLRSAATISITASIVFGVFLQVLIGNYLHWRTLVLISLIDPLMSFLGMLMLPESPMWLASKGRLVEAERALCWLRGWTTPAIVQSEYVSMLQAQSRSTDDCASERPRDSRSLAERYFRRGVLLPFGLAIVVYFVDAFGGDVALVTYAVLIFRMLHSPIDEYTAAVLLTGLQVLAMLLLMTVVGRIGKRPPIIGSLAIAAVCFFGIAIYSFVVNGDNIEESNYKWIPTLLVLVTMFILAGGIRNAPWFISSEIFPVDSSRSVVVSVAAALFNVMAGLANKSFLNIVETLTLPGAFLLLGIINLLGCTVLYRFMPETEGKSFAEIEEYFAKKPSPKVDAKGNSQSFKQTRL